MALPPRNWLQSEDAAHRIAERYGCSIDEAKNALLGILQDGATVHLPYDICISLLSNAESTYIPFIVNAMNVAFKSNVTGRH